MATFLLFATALSAMVKFEPKDGPVSIWSQSSMPDVETTTSGDTDVQAVPLDNATVQATPSDGAAVQAAVTRSKARDMAKNSHATSATKLESAIRESIFDKKPTRELQNKIARGSFSSSQVSELPKDLVAEAANHKYAHWVVSCLIQNFPEIMLSKLSFYFSVNHGIDDPSHTFLFTKLTETKKEYGSYIAKAFVKSNSLEIEDRIFGEMHPDVLHQHLCQTAFARNALDFVKSPRIALYIVNHLFDYTSLEHVQKILPSVWRCAEKHDFPVAKLWIIENFSREAIRKATVEATKFSYSGRYTDRYFKIAQSKSQQTENLFREVNHKQSIYR